MMEKRSVGIKILGVILLLLAIYNGLSLIRAFLIIEDVTTKEGFWGLTTLQIVKTVVFFVLGVGILQIKSWARKTLVYLTGLYIAVTAYLIATSVEEGLSIRLISYITYFIFSILIVWYLNKRPVKTQFTK